MNPSSHLSAEPPLYNPTASCSDDAGDEEWNAPNERVDWDVLTTASRKSGRKAPNKPSGGTPASRHRDGERHVAFAEPPSTRVAALKTIPPVDAKNSPY